MKQCLHVYHTITLDVGHWTPHPLDGNGRNQAIDKITACLPELLLAATRGMRFELPSYLIGFLHSWVRSGALPKSVLAGLIMNLAM